MSADTEKIHPEIETQNKILMTELTIEKI